MTNTEAIKRVDAMIESVREMSNMLASGNYIPMDPQDDGRTVMPIELEPEQEMATK